MDAPSRRKTLLWLQAAGCGGCSMAAFGAEERGLSAALAPFGLDLLWHPSLSAETGGELLAILDAIRDRRQRLDILCIEGAALLGPANTGRYQLMAGTDRAMADWIRELADFAGTVVAVGACAAFGGITAAPGSVTEATGLQFQGDQPGGLLDDGFRAGGGLPVVNIAGCAPHPDWILGSLAAIALGDLAGDDLDAFGRPRFFADHLAHQGCSRNEFYEFKASADRLGQGGCMMEHLGCKATRAVGDCATRVWNGGKGCTDGGYPCIACTAPDFAELSAPYAETAKVAGIPVGLPVDMPRAWFVALAALSKSATPQRVRENAHADRVAVPPAHKSLRR